MPSTSLYNAAATGEKNVLSRVTERVQPNLYRDKLINGPPRIGLLRLALAQCQRILVKLGILMALRCRSPGTLVRGFRSETTARCYGVTFDTS